MNKYLIPIDHNSVRPNPRAGRNDLLVPGRMVKLETIIVNGFAEDYVNGRFAASYCVDLPDQTITKFETEDTTIFNVTPEPSYLYEYEMTTVECYRCGSMFPHTALKEEWQDKGNQDVLRKNVCPMCDRKDCCEIEYEQFRLEN